MKRTLASGVAFALLLCAAPPGMRPRADVLSYPSHESRSDSSIGAALIPPDQAKKILMANLNKAGYVVVEVGVFPSGGSEVDLYPADFTLFVGENVAPMRPVDPGAIAENIARPDSGPPRSGRRDSRDVELSTGVAIGHGTYSDPVTGRRTGSTITTTEAGVGIGGPAPNSCRTQICDSPAPAPPANTRSRTQTARAIEQELWEKSLPDGKVRQAVAGYLYFPKPSGKAKDAAWELRYENSAGRTRLRLPRS